MKIFLDGYFANNFGDDLMIQGLLKKYPKYHFFAVSSQEEIKNTYKNFDNIRFINKFDRKIIYDYYVFIGGSIYEFIHFKNIRYHFYRLSRMILSKKRGTKIFTIGANLGNYNLKIGRKIILKELEMQDLITVRDKYSFDLLNKYNVSTKKYMIQDIAFEILMNYERKENKKTIDIQNILGISSFKLDPKYINAIANIIRDYLLISENNVARIFSFNPESQNDSIFARKIREKVPEELHKSIELIDYQGNVDGFLESVSACSKFIAVRFHSAIMAYIFEIPFLPIIYSNKTENFLNDIDYMGERFYTNDMISNSEMKIAFNKIEEKKYKSPHNYLTDNYQKHFSVFDKNIIKKEV